MPRPVLPGFVFSRTAARYRDTSTGQFVSRTRVLDLMEQQVASSEERLSQIVQGVFDKSIAPGVGQEMMRDELRRLSMTNRALGKGGLDQLDFRDYGAVGRQLREDYQRATNLLNDIAEGKTTLPQALRRIEGYTLEGRNQFFAAQRAAAQNTGRLYEERRILHARESCPDCIDYAAEGWVAQGTLPLPGEQSQCGKYCRCTMESRQVEQERMAA